MIIAEIEISSSVAKVKQCDVMRSNAKHQSLHLRQYEICEADGNLLPVGACGLKVKFTFVDPAWGNLSKTAVFRNKNITLDAVIMDDCATIPHEVLSKVMDVVEVGVYGTDSEKYIAIPTVWAKLGTVVSAANPTGGSSSEPTLPYWAQLKEQLDTVQEQMMDKVDLQEALVEAKESGAFDGPQGVPGEKGDKGDTGASGYTPIKGVDYWTQTEQEGIVTEAANIASKAVNSSSDIVCEAEGDTILLGDSADRELHGLKVYGKTIQNGTPTPEAPVELESVGEGGSIGVTVCGKNMFDVANSTVNSSLVNALSYKTETGIRFTGTQSGNTNIWVFLKEPFLLRAGTPITLSYDCQSASTYFSSVYIHYKKVLNESALDIVSPAVFSEDVYITGLHLWNKDAGLTYDVLFDNIQFEINSVATAYEPYKGQTLTAQTPNGLPGIPVSSGGNYTDENGQQWICDEIDFARGKYVQRVQQHTNLVFWGQGGEEGHYIYGASLFGSSNQENIKVLSTHFAWQPNTTLATVPVGCMVTRVGNTLPVVSCISTISTVDEFNMWIKANNVRFCAPLATPIETNLTAEELAAYAALHTNYPNTTIYNDEGAGMAVKYVADTKLYIDNKFAELAKAIVNA